MPGSTSERRVVITGLGVVSALGQQMDVFWKNLLEGQCGIDRITSFDVTEYDCQIAAEIKNFDPLSSFPSAKEVRRSDRFTQFGVVAYLSDLESAVCTRPKNNTRYFSPKGRAGYLLS